jgi:hypothetical protein
MTPSHSALEPEQKAEARPARERPERNPGREEAQQLDERQRGSSEGL